MTSQLKSTFHGDEYSMLIVAEKYQTGFDEPLLHSMYVDKKLKDVSAVQTLSRLNRMCKGKTSTFVLDFVNTDEEIKESFQPYYETTLLDGRTDFNKVYDLRTKIQPYMLYNFDDVECYYDFMSRHKDSKQGMADLGRLSSILKPVIARYFDIGTEEERFDCRMAIRSFVKSYAYVTQLVRLHDEELFKEYVFLSNLLRFLPIDRDGVRVKLDDKIKLDYVQLKESFKGAIVLDKKDTDLLPSNDKGKTKTVKKDTLQNIIDKVNERFDGAFSDTDRNLIESIYRMLLSDKGIKKLERCAKNTTSEMFEKSLFPEKFKEIATQCYLENSDSYKKLFTDTEYYREIMEAMAKELYRFLRRD